MSNEILCVDTLLTLLQSQPQAQKHIIGKHTIPAHDADFSPQKSVLGDAFPRLYTHQNDVLAKTRQKKHVVIATATASGKTLATTLPYLVELKKNSNARLLCIAPTLALVEQWHEQLARWCPDTLVKTFTGATPHDEKEKIRQQAQVVVTTPDMFHQSMLPYHRGWRTFYQELRYVIIDENHIYRGVFGTHMALVLHRFQRILPLYQKELPTFLFATATIGNPKEHAETLLRQSVEAITSNGAPSGERSIVLWQPTNPVMHSEAAADLMAFFVKQGVRTLLFGQQRQAVERIAKNVRQQLCQQDRTKIMAYRSGYLPQQRKTIQDDLVKGNLLGVVSTNALELGIDVGDLDVVIIDGFPGSVSSLWQQAGRAGRGKGSALVILVLRENALDQYFATYSERLFEASAECALLNAQNPYILRSHLHSAAKELPLTLEDIDAFGHDAVRYAEDLVRENFFIKKGNMYHLRDEQSNPAHETPLRQIGAPFTIVDEQNCQIEDTIDLPHAVMECYPGAIYLSRGVIYQVEKLDMANLRVCTRRCSAAYYTEPLVQVEITIVKPYPETTMLPHTQVCVGEVNVKKTVYGYTCRQNRTHTRLRTEELKEPLPLTLQTQACWLNIDDALLQQAKAQHYDPLGSLHAIEHAMISFLPLFILGDARDMGGASFYPSHPQTQSATFFLYDGYPGGIGYAQEAFHLIRKLADATLEALLRCPCTRGCYACIQSPQCGSKNQHLDKGGAIFLLRVLVGDCTVS